MASTVMQRPHFLELVKNAKPGTNIVYHVGLLAKDRSQGANFIDVNSTACAAWEAMEEGIVLLLQRRVAEGVYEYRARKLAPPHVPMDWTGPYAKPNTKHMKPPVVAARHATAAVTA